MVRFWIGVTTVLVAAGLATPDPRGDAAQGLANECGECSSSTASGATTGRGRRGASSTSLSQPDLLAKEFWDPVLVVPGKPEASYLFERVVEGARCRRGTSSSGRPGRRRTALRAWIAAGAPAFPDDAGEAAVRDARRRSSRPPATTSATPSPTTGRSCGSSPCTTWPTTRRVKDADLRLARAALSKAINSLSRKPRIVVPGGRGPGEDGLSPSTSASSAGTAATSGRPSSGPTPTASSTTPTPTKPPPARPRPLRPDRVRPPRSSGPTGSSPRRPGRRSTTPCSNCPTAARALERELGVEVADELPRPPARADRPRGVPAERRLGAEPDGRAARGRGRARTTGRATTSSRRTAAPS